MNSSYEGYIVSGWKHQIIQHLGVIESSTSLTNAIRLTYWRTRGQASSPTKKYLIQPLLHVQLTTTRVSLTRPIAQSVIFR